MQLLRLTKAHAVWQEKGRQAVRDAGVIPVLIELLPSADVPAAARAAGALHNLSCDQASVRAIQRGDGLQPLVNLLRSCIISLHQAHILEASVPALLVDTLVLYVRARGQDTAAAASAAGALQNLSREPASRQAIAQMGAIAPLAKLLLVPSLQVQQPAARLQQCIGRAVCTITSVIWLGAGTGVCNGCTAEHAWTHAGGPRAAWTREQEAPGTAAGLRSEPVHHRAVHLKEQHKTR